METKDKHGTSRKIYKSKVGLEIIVPIILILVAIMIFNFREGNWITALMPLLMFVFIVSLLYSISYEVHEKKILVKSLFFKSIVPIKTISAIQDTRNPISAPAASLDRMEIFYGDNKSIVISPKNKIGFISHLKELSPSIQVNVKNWKEKT